MRMYIHNSNRSTMLKSVNTMLRYILKRYSEVTFYEYVDYNSYVLEVKFNGNTVRIEDSLVECSNENCLSSLFKKILKESNKEIFLTYSPSCKIYVLK